VATEEMIEAAAMAIEGISWSRLGYNAKANLRLSATRALDAAEPLRPKPKAVAWQRKRRADSDECWQECTQHAFLDISTSVDQYWQVRELFAGPPS